jgi:hypothetical protein
MEGRNNHVQPLQPSVATDYDNCDNSYREKGHTSN